MPNWEDIFDGPGLSSRLEELAGWSGVSAKTRPKVVALFKDVLERGRAEVRRRFEAGELSGYDATAANTYLIDRLIRAIHDFATGYVYPVANPTIGEQIALVATGGYGRGELAPHSDVDLMFLLPYKQTPHGEQVAEYMLYTLWDMNLKVGHSTRSIEDCVRLAKADLTIRTSLLDARHLGGEEVLFQRFQKRFASAVVAPSRTSFLEEKLTERDSRHERMGDSRYVLEPNVKEGKGGLRDLQTLFWIAKFLYGVDHVGDLVERGVLTPADGSRFRRARNYLWTVRCHLHYLAGRAEERLSFSVQGVISQRMGYKDRIGQLGVERFMKHYFLVAKNVGDLTRILCAVWEDEHAKRRRLFRLPSLRLSRRGVEGFRMDGERLTVENDDAFLRDPVKLIRLFHEAQRLELDIHPHALRLATQSLHLIDRKLCEDPEANRLFLEILCSDRDPERALKRLNEAGVFGRFIPEFGRVVALMQYDMYHVYTVDEHTIRAIGILHRIEKGELTEDYPVASKIIGEVKSRRVLYVALLLHDIAKGRGGDHSKRGAEIALRLCPRLGLDDWETETVAWLVRDHLIMSHTAFRRDVDDTKTVADFVARVQSPERLRLLVLLTAADIRAVGPDVWNAWKAALLRELYYRAEEVMTGGIATARRSARVEQAKAALKCRLEGWSEAEIEAHFGRGYERYWLAFDTEALTQHAEFVRAAEQENRRLHIETKVDTKRAVTELTIYAPDHPGLFSQIAGGIALSGASIVDAKITTLANGMALDTLSIQDSRGGAFDDPAALKKLWARVERAVSGNIDLPREFASRRRSAMPSRTQVFAVSPHVVVDNLASNHHTVIEVYGRDRVGFLYDVTSALTGLGLQISSAHITTYGERAVDVFYVKDVFGLKVEHDDKLKQIEARLLAAIAGCPAGVTEDGRHPKAAIGSG